MLTNVRDIFKGSTPGRTIRGARERAGSAWGTAKKTAPGFAEVVWFRLCCHRHGFLHSIVYCLGFCGRDIADWLHEAAVVEPVDPCERCHFDGLEGLPWRPPVDQLGFVEAVDCFGERVAVAVSDAADRWLDAGLSQALGVFDRDILGGFNRSVHLRAIPTPDGRSRRHLLDEPLRQCLGQRSDEKLLFIAQNRAEGTQNLPNPRCRHGQRVRLNRTLLQRST